MPPPSRGAATSELSCFPMTPRSRATAARPCRVPRRARTGSACCPASAQRGGAADGAPVREPRAEQDARLITSSDPKLVGSITVDGTRFQKLLLSIQLYLKPLNFTELQ